MSTVIALKHDGSIQTIDDVVKFESTDNVYLAEDASGTTHFIPKRNVKRLATVLQDEVVEALGTI